MVDISRDMGCFMEGEWNSGMVMGAGWKWLIFKGIWGVDEKIVKK